MGAYVLCVPAAIVVVDWIYTLVEGDARPPWWLYSAAAVAGVGLAYALHAWSDA